MKSVDVIVVLSGGVLEDGTLPPNAQLRVKKGVELFHSGIAHHFVLTGKWGYLMKHTPARTEAQAMRDYAISLGIPANKISIEEESVDTLGNAYFCKKQILEPKEWHSLIVVSSDYHIPRTEYLFRKVLGPEYEISYAASQNIFDEERRKAKKEKEARSLALAQKWLDDINDGDDASIHELMFTKHPGYAENPEYSIEQLIKELT